MEEIAVWYIQATGSYYNEIFLPAVGVRFIVSTKSYN